MNLFESVNKSIWFIVIHLNKNDTFEIKGKSVRYSDIGSK